MNPKHLRLFVIRPTLKRAGLWSRAAEDLVLGTAAAESGFKALDQVTGLTDEVLGPAFGLYQIEPATHNDLWKNCLVYNPAARAHAESHLAPIPSAVEQLVTNLAYATLICRLIYWRQKEPLPAAGDLAGYARYWKQHYNTPLGAGTPAGFVAKYEAAGCGFCTA